MAEKVETMIVQGDELSVQLEDSDPAESLRVQAETDQLKVVQCTVGSNVDVVVKRLSIFNWLLSKGPKSAYLQLAVE